MCTEERGHHISQHNDPKLSSKSPEGIPQRQPEIYIRIMSKRLERTENLHVRLLFQDIPDLARDKSAM